MSLTIRRNSRFLIQIYEEFFILPNLFYVRTNKRTNNLINISIVDL